VAKGLSLLLLLLSSFVLSAEITSRLMYTDEEGNVIAEGEVEALYSGYLVKANRVKYNPRTKEIYAYGNVYIKKLDNSLEVWGDEAYIDLRRERGYFLKARGRVEQFYFAAERIEKVGEKLYEVSDGEVTTCPPDRKELKICFWKARVSENYVFSFGNSLKFFKVPFLYSPLVAFPVGSRRTGFLPPFIGTGSYNDFLYIQPFFWAISRDKDATFTLDYRSDQAKGISAEYRQALSLRDKLFAKISLYKEPSPPGEWWTGRDLGTFRENRFRIEFSLRYRNWKLGLDIPSDPYFFEDIYFSRDLRTKPFTLSYITYTKLDRKYFLSLNLRSYYDLTSNSQKNSLHLLPEAGFYLRPRRLGPLFVSLTSMYTNFYRVNSPRYSRLIFIPQLETSLNLFGLQNYTSLRVMNNFYFNGSSSQNFDERVTSFLFENRVPLFKRLSFHKLELDNTLEAVYRFSPENFNTPQFDTFDEVIRENNLRFRYSGLISFKGRSVASIFLEGGYNLLRSYRFPTDSRLVDKPFLPVRGILSIYPVEWLSISQDFTYDINLGIFARRVSSVSLNLGRVSLSGSFFTSKDSYGKKTTDQYSLGGGIRYRSLFAGAYLTRDILSSKELHRRFFIGIKGACWALKLDFKRTYYGGGKGFLREVLLTFNLFNLRDIKLPLRKK